MSEIKSFQDLKIWQEAHQLTLRIYKISDKFPKDEIYSLTSQVRKSASSVSANIAEGMGRNTTKELMQFCYNARGSIHETISHLILAKDLCYLAKLEFDELEKRYQGLNIGINNFINSLKKTL